MKPLTNMQLALDVVIISIGLSTALWIFSKAILNIVLAANQWVNIPRQPRCAPSEVNSKPASQKYHA